MDDDLPDYGQQQDNEQRQREEEMKALTDSKELASDYASHVRHA